MAALDRGMTQRHADLLTLRTAWPLYFPKHQLPAEKWLRNWLNHNTAAVVVAAFEFASTGGSYNDSTHLHKVLTTMLKTVTFTQ